MKLSVRKELASVILDAINDGFVHDNNIDELHQLIFNEDCFIVGYYQATQWLKNHDICVFDAIDTVREYELDIFGDFTTKINSESIVNMLAYIWGEELISEIDFDTIEELENELYNI